MREMCSPNDTKRTTKAVRLARLGFCAFGIVSCYLTYGVLQEKLYDGEGSTDPSVVLLSQCITNVLVALIWNGTSIQSSLPHRLLQVTALCYVTAMLCSNESIMFVSYPVLVLAKSCKLIPTMVVGQLVEGRRLYGANEWFAAAGICCGILLFQLTKLTATTDKRSDSRGLVLLAVSLSMDGVLSACQNRIKECAVIPNAAETMLCLNAYASILLVPYCVVKTQLLGSGVPEVPSTELIISLSILNLTVAVGQIFIFLTISWFNSVTTTLVTTTRKFLTILVSVVYYGHHFSSAQWAGVVMVFCGLYTCIYQTVERQAAKQKQG